MWSDDNIVLTLHLHQNSDALGSTIETSVPYPDKRARSSEVDKNLSSIN